jgi:hypothetical protein
MMDSAQVVFSNLCEVAATTINTGISLYNAAPIATQSVVVAVALVALSLLAMAIIYCVSRLFARKEPVQPANQPAVPNNAVPPQIDLPITDQAQAAIKRLQDKIKEAADSGVTFEDLGDPQKAIEGLNKAIKVCDLALEAKKVLVLATSAEEAKLAAEDIEKAENAVLLQMKPVAAFCDKINQKIIDDKITNYLKSAVKDDKLKFDATHRSIKSEINQLQDKLDGSNWGSTILSVPQIEVAIENLCRIGIAIENTACGIIVANAAKDNSNAINVAATDIENNNELIQNVRNELKSFTEKYHEKAKPSIPKAESNKSYAVTDYITKESAITVTGTVAGVVGATLFGVAAAPALAIGGLFAAGYHYREKLDNAFGH